MPRRASLGHDGFNYAQKGGMQLAAIKAMSDRLAHIPR
jgi:hypothetical protein